MNLIARSALLLIGLVCLASFAFSQATPSDVHVKLVLADNKNIFRIGEPIKFWLEFTADRDGYQTDTIADRSEPTVDALQVSPDSGTYHWLEEIRSNSNLMWGRDVVSFQRLSTIPVRVELVLNDTIRIDRPGKYSARITTRRVRVAAASRSDFPPAIALITNEVTFEVEEMTDADEAKEVKRISDQLDATRDAGTRQTISQELAYLSGDVSSREKVRRFLNDNDMYYGLHIARNRALVLQLLEAAMRDPKTPVETALLGTATSLKFLVQNQGLPRGSGALSAFDPNPDPRVLAIKESYVRELAAGLGKRTGPSQSITAMTVLTNLPKDPKDAAPLLTASRQIVLEQFENLSIFGHEQLLERYWDVLRDPSLISVLKKLLTSPDRMTKGIHRTLLKRLIDLSPDEAKPYVIAEIRDPQSIVDPEILGALPDKTLPEVDQPLLSLLRGMAKMPGALGEIWLARKAAVAVRFATASIYPDLMTVYTENVKQLTVRSRASLLAYLAKQNERETLPLIEEALAELPPNQEFNFLPALTSLYYSEGISSILRKRLESDEPEMVSTAAYVMGKYGDAGDQKILEARLERWRKEWEARQLEADMNQQGRIESELVSALNRAKDGTISPERVKELRQSCITKICKQQFPSPLP
jgi:hypothetical protein